MGRRGLFLLRASIRRPADRRVCARGVVVCVLTLLGLAPQHGQRGWLGSACACHQAAGPQGLACKGVHSYHAASVGSVGSFLATGTRAAQVKGRQSRFLPQGARWAGEAAGGVASCASRSGGLGWPLAATARLGFGDFLDGAFAGTSARRLKGRRRACKGAARSIRVAWRLRCDRSSQGVQVGRRASASLAVSAGAPGKPKPGRSRRGWTDGARWPARSRGGAAEHGQ
jgi:hypothetical protein